MSLTDFLRDVGKHFTVNQMIAKDIVKSRLDRDDVGLSFTEFSYMLLQAYDFLRLNLDHDCTLQLGGSDQWGNITVGTELVRKATGHRADGVTTPLLLRADGQKFGKSESGNEHVWLDATMTSPFAMHQFLLNADDVAAPAMLRYFTFLDHETILETRRGDAHASRKSVGPNAPRRTPSSPSCTVPTPPNAPNAPARRCSPSAIAELDEATLLQVVADAPSSNVARAELERRHRRRRPRRALSNWRRRWARRGASSNRAASTSTTCASTSARASTRTQLLHGRYVILRRGRRQMHLVVAA